jgi:TPR repeat protein
MIVDYADRWPLTHLNWLLSNALLHQLETPARVLLLARTSYTWPAVRSGLDKLEAGVSDRLLGALPDGPMPRERMFAAARDGFADRYGIADRDVIVPPARLDHSEFGLTLTVHMAALVAVDAHVNGRRPPQDMAGLTAYLLDRERQHWTRLYERGLQGLEFRTPPSVMSRAVFTAALTGPVDPPSGKAILDGLDLELHPERVLTDHKACYPAADPTGATVLEPLYPDRLAEDFLALSMPGHLSNHPPEAWAPMTATTLLARGIDDSPESYVPRAITFLATAAERWPHVAERFLNPLLRRDPQLAIDAGSAALTALAAIRKLDLDVLEGIERLLPDDRNVDLDIGIAAITRRLTDHRLAQSTRPAQQAALYAVLGERLANAGRHPEALAASEQAVDLYVQLSTAHPGAYEPELATALNSHGIHLSNVGRREEALAAIEQAVEIRRRVATANPAHEVFLATALSNLGWRLSEFGHWEEALAVTEQAVELFQRLATINPTAVDSGLAGCLLNLGMVRSGLGRREQALAATDQAVKLFQRLAAANPSTYEPRLATSLNNLAADLWDLGHWEEALVATDQAVKLYQRLAAINAAAFEADFAMCLHNLGLRLSGLGHWEEALAAAEEAVEIRRRLAAANPARHEPDLASSLGSLGGRRLRLGRLEEAVTPIEQAVEVYKRLAAANPTAYEMHLAGELHNLGWVLSEGGRRGEALAATEQAVEIRRRLAAANPAVHEAGLAKSLTNLGMMLSNLGRWEQALAPTEQAVALCRRLAADNPANERDLARALWRAAWVRAEGKADLQTALGASSAAVQTYLGLAKRVPGAFDDEVHGASSTLADVLELLGQGQDAAEIRAAIVGTELKQAEHDHDRRQDPPPVHERTWSAALDPAIDASSTWSVGSADYEAGQMATLSSAIQPLAVIGDADAGNTEAMFNLGVLLQEQDPAAARRWYERAAEAGHAGALYNVGVTVASEDPAAARSWYERAANAGSTEAMFNLGVLLHEQDPAAARRWYERAANAGNSNAMNNLGALILDEDPAAARGWFEQAANAGRPDAMYNLGTLLAGLEPPDLNRVRRWWRKAADGGNAIAMVCLSSWLAVEGEVDEARRLLRTAIQSGMPAARDYLSILDRDFAVREADHATLEAVRGDTDALNFLGVAALRGGIPDEARTAWMRSASAGDSVSPLLLRISGLT